MNMFKRWLLKRKLKPMTDTWGTTPDEFMFITGLSEELRRHQRGELRPHEVEELRSILARPSTRAIYAKLERAGVLRNRENPFPPELMKNLMVSLTGEGALELLGVHRPAEKE